MQNDSTLVIRSSWEEFLDSEGVKEVSSVESAGRQNKLVVHLGEDGSKTYAVATLIDGFDHWRFALLMRGPADWGFNFLRELTEDPKLTVYDLSYKDKKGNTVSLMIPTLYQLPFLPNKKIGGREVADVGNPLWNGYNQSAIVPVRFKDGTYAIAFCENRRVDLFTSVNTEVMRLITHSSKMPRFREGLGSGVWHIGVNEGEERILIKTYYNDKAGRPEEIHR